jgi:hypothetical protein
MAMEALSGPQDCIEHNNATYKARRDRVVSVLRDIGLEVESPKASLYVWAKVPPGFTSAEFAARLLEDGKPMEEALVALTVNNLSNPTPHPWYSAYHDSHPTTVERVHAIRAAAEAGPTGLAPEGAGGG